VVLLIYRFADVSVDVRRRALQRGGESIAVEPQVFDLLQYLIENRGRIVSKDDLIGGVWNGRIVSDSTLSSRLTAVRQAIGDSGEKQCLIRTIPRKGFRFVGEISQQRNDFPQFDAPSAHPQAAAGLMLPDKPSIAVLAFRNLSNDVAQEYFVDGVVEDITTALSQLSQLFVVARSSSYTYKGRTVDVKQIGRELGVRYVLEGSIRKTAGHVRLTVQLIDSLAAVQLWATNFDGALDQVFHFQDQVTVGVVNVIAPKIEHAEIQRAKRKPPGSLDSYDYYLHGLANSYQDTKEASDQALRSFGRAIELDPDFAAAYGMAALCYVERWWKRWMLDPQREVAEVAGLVNRAVALGRNDAVALSAAGMALGLVVRDLDQAVALLDRALLLSPSLAASWVRSAWVRLFLGQFDLAIEHASRAMRLSPLDPLLVGMQTVIAFAHFCAGRYMQAVTWSETALMEQANFAPAMRVLAASAASLDRMDEAAKWLARLKGDQRRLLRISEVTHFPFRDPIHAVKYQEALRKAGFEE
jgi:TolB-like protein/tetratricopeptide (TPR) repeat protein